MSSESDVRKLLKIRADLEARAEELKIELENLKLALLEIDQMIVKQGFKQPSPFSEQIKPNIQKLSDQPKIEPKVEVNQDGSSVLSKDGTVLGKVLITEDQITFTPKEELTFTTSIPPFQSFLIDRVLANMKSTDESRVVNGELQPEKILDYRVESDGEVIKSLIVRNYGGERRLREIQSSLRWSLDKMYEKIRRG